MSKQQMAAAFNEWMRRYTEDPAGFEAEFQTVGKYLAEKAAGEEPSYGDVCAEFISDLAEVVS